jgi:hypothetical protein
MNEDTSPIHENSPFPNADSCLPGAIGLDSSGQGALRTDNPGRNEEPLFFPSAEIAATHSTRKHARRVSKTSSPACPRYERSRVAICLPTCERVHVTAPCSCLSRLGPLDHRLPCPPATLLDRTEPVGSFESTQNVALWPFRPGRRRKYAPRNRVGSGLKGSTHDWADSSIAR